MAVDENEVRKDLKALKRLRNQCEKAKKKLSNNDSAIINIYNFFEGLDLYIKIVYITIKISIFVIFYHNTTAKNF